MIHSNLFISNFKFMKKIMSRLLSIIVAFIILQSALRMLDYIYVRKDNWARILWHNFYATTENIDNIFVGSSHVYCDINPLILDEINGMNNFNISVADMRLNASYYAIKEATKMHELKNVYLELYYCVTVGEPGDVMSDRCVQHNWRTTDYLHPSINKLQFILSMSDTDKYMETLLPFTRYREHLFNLPYIVSNIELKKSEDYNQFHYLFEDEQGIDEYRNKGYYYTTRQLQETSLIYNAYANVQTDLMHPNSERYLRKIIEYCQNHNINIELFVSPIFELQTLSSVEYDLYYQQISSIANEYAIPFYDFNLCKPEYLDIMHRENFMDIGHLNNTGADIFTPFLWEVLSHDFETNQQYFCQSYEDKIHLDAPKVYGVYYYDDENMKNFTIASNRDNEIEYRIIVTPYEGDPRIIQDFSGEKDFSISHDEHGLLTIISRVIGQPEKTETLELPY